MPIPLTEYNGRLRDRGLQLVICSNSYRIQEEHYELRRWGLREGLVHALRGVPINSDRAIVPDSILTMIANFAGVPRHRPDDGFHG